MSFNLGTGISAINTILAEEANRIGQDIYNNTVHVSPWLDLTKQTKFADGMGYQQTTLIYDRALPTTDTSGNSQGVTWTDVGTLSTGGNTFNASLSGDNAQPLDDTADDVQGARGTGSADNRSYVQFGKKLKKYSLKRAVIESPRIALEDLRFAAHRQEQLRAIMDVLTQSTRHTWEERYRDEYELNCANLTCCLAAGSVTRQTVDSDGDGTSDDTYEGNSLFNGTFDLATSGASNADITPDANISNAVMDKIYFQMIRKGAGAKAYGRENGRPVFAVAMSSEASYFLQTEAGFRDDVRYNNAKVSDLIAPLGVEKSFRGFYHLVDDLAPRFTEVSGVLTRVQPYITSSGVTIPNTAYETATHEAAFVLHPEVCEAQIPDPMTGGGGVTFNPVNYRGKFDWKNILNEVTNPDGSIGFFRGVLASATKPIKTDFGTVILFKRDSATPSA